MKNKKEIINYIIFGVLTTVVNFIVYWLFNRILGKNYYLVSNVIAWIAAVAFAYVTNKIWVFESKVTQPKALAKEIVEFFIARLFSLGVEEAGLLILVDLMMFKNISFELFTFTITGEILAKIVLAVVVVVLNYIFSKFIIFKKDRN